jgi:oxygen-independent coproporphyrinogen-3 oxidase
MGLRLCTGIKLKDLVQTYGINELNYYKDIIEGFINQGLLEMDKGYLRLSRKAYFLSNQVICHFLPDLES